MRLSIALLAALALTGITSAKATEDIHSANAIMPGCRALLSHSSDDDSLVSFKAGVCAGTIDGLLFEASLLGRSTGVGVPHAEVFCAPKEITNDQALRVVVRYIDARPEEMHKGFAFLALMALTNAWPCR